MRHKRQRSGFGVVLVLFGLVTAGGAWYWKWQQGEWGPGREKQAAVEQSAGQYDEAKSIEEISFSTEALEAAVLQEAVRRKWIEFSARGNGRDHCQARLKNLRAVTLRLRIPFGLILREGHSLVIVVRSAEITVAPGVETSVRLETAAIHASNQIYERNFELTNLRSEKLRSLLRHVARNRQLQLPAIQTAILAFVENHPLSLFARFELIAGKSAATEDVEWFQVETRHIIAALQILEALGISQEHVALGVDPQLKIEAMIDPLAHEPAKTLYQISDREEWQFWEDHLLHGDMATRHYALFGIAQYFPEVALKMLPRWIREDKLKPLFRTSAIYSMAHTRKYEALSILQNLLMEYQEAGELELALVQSQRRLSQTLHDPVRIELPVEFKATEPMLMGDPPPGWLPTFLSRDF